MTRILSILLLTLLFSAANADSWYEYDYDHNLLTFFWPPEFCHTPDTVKCKDGWNTPEGGVWDGKRFTLHGFWPGSHIGYLGRDPRCLTDKEVDMKALFGDD